MCANEMMSPKRASDEYIDIIAKNLEKLIDSTDYSQNSLSLELRKHGLNVNQGTISKYIHGQSKVQLSVIIKLCDIFQISISDLADKNFQYNNYPIITKDSCFEKNNSENTNLVILNFGKNFITNPYDEDFQGYLQKYYCYFFPTLSQENEILIGEIKLSAVSTYCEATLSLNTRKEKCGKPIYKYYTGCAIISKAVETCYIILSSPEEGEICFINLRHFFIRHQDLDCRMAEVITNGAGERHFPTVHRMLLSRESIKEEHLQYLMSHLYLNSSDIHIKKEKLEKLEAESKVYKDLIDHLCHRIKPVETYDFKEDYVISNAKQFLSKDETRLFLSLIRNNSYKVRYNKVSNKLDEIVRELLLTLGYYTES